MKRPAKKSAAAPPAVSDDDLQPRVAARHSPLVFVSHDSRDADLAEAFSNLLTDVGAGMLKSFRASDKKGTSGIPFGAEWYRSIMSQLEESTDVVALLTPQSIERPWILYEAGVAKGKLETTVLGIALGAPLENVSAGPFGQFQNCGGDEDSLTKLVMQLLERNPDAAPREEAVRMQVKIFRQEVTNIFDQRGKEAAVPAKIDEESNVAKLFEEIKAMVRELPSRVSDRAQATSRSKPLARRRFHSAMMEELIMHAGMRGEPNGEAAAILLIVSLFRDDLPWLYEPGVELYRALRSRSARAIEDARKQFSRMIEMTDHPIFFELTRGGDEETFFMMRELPRLLDRMLSRGRLVNTRVERVPAAEAAKGDGEKP